ncbi:hypothetical protein [Pseudonocardia endophytica]|uniref:Uncharacterized protein n=1 Tax=Pseudonocardia endophytica TaxID=401976 RepID=A0A4R1HZ87_PSEEN|nr:hypothetical protein [Pseudonocardia endophytica]TCK25439.1 hypothetical protein EV378_1247 [Pseudonocardia endophytica]
MTDVDGGESVDGDGGVSPERLRAARRLAERAGAPRLPYPAREATDVHDAALLGAVELLSDPEWLAANWIDDADAGVINGGG